MVFIPSKITVDHADGTQDVISIPKEGEGLDQGEDFSKTGVSRVIVKKYFLLKMNVFKFFNSKKNLKVSLEKSFLVISI